MIDTRTMTTAEEPVDPNNSSRQMERQTIKGQYWWRFFQIRREGEAKVARNKTGVQKDRGVVRTARSLWMSECMCVVVCKWILAARSRQQRSAHRLFQPIKRLPRLPSVVSIVHDTTSLQRRATSHQENQHEQSARRPTHTLATTSTNSFSLI